MNKFDKKNQGHVITWSRDNGIFMSKTLIGAIFRQQQDIDKLNCSPNTTKQNEGTQKNLAQNSP